MTFNELCSNVDRWANACMIPTESTQNHQIAKACGEFGELLEGCRLDDMPGIMDAIGDMTVCLINASTFEQSLTCTVREDMKHAFEECDSSHPEICLAEIAKSLTRPYFSRFAYMHICRDLSCLCNYYSIDANECFEMAWNEIKDRRLIMRDGLAVKWENMTAEEKNAWNISNSGSIDINDSFNAVQ